MQNIFGCEYELSNSPKGFSLCMLQQYCLKGLYVGVILKHTGFRTLLIILLKIIEDPQRTFLYVDCISLLIFKIVYVNENFQLKIIIINPLQVNISILWKISIISKTKKLKFDKNSDFLTFLCAFIYLFIEDSWFLISAFAFHLLKYSLGCSI